MYRNFEEMVCVSKKACRDNCLEELYLDLEMKAAIDVDATVRLIEALEDIVGGKNPDEVMLGTALIDSGLVLPGKSPMELGRKVIDLRGQGINSANLHKIIGLRNSLYRYQSLYLK